MSQHESSQAQLSGTKPEDTFYEADDTGLTYAGRLGKGRCTG